jgi:nucleoside-diphosphate-sugar epimerase
MARIYCAMLEIPKEQISGKILNAGWNKQNYMKKEIIQIIKEVIGEFEVDSVKTIEDKRSYRVDFTKIQKLLKFSPLVSVKDGVAEVANAVKTGLLTEQDFENNRLK